MKSRKAKGAISSSTLVGIILILNINVLPPLVFFRITVSSSSWRGDGVAARDVAARGAAARAIQVSSN